MLLSSPAFNSNEDYSAPVGSEAAGAVFKDTWKLSDVDEAWHGEIADKEPALYAIIDAAGLSHGQSMKSDLIMMAVRLLEMRRLLKPTGSLYLHCDPTAGHRLKMTLDCVFGRANFRSALIWRRTNAKGLAQASHNDDSSAGSPPSPPPLPVVSLSRKTPVSQDMGQARRLRLEPSWFGQEVRDRVGVVAQQVKLGLVRAVQSVRFLHHVPQDQHPQSHGGRIVMV